MNNKDVLYVAKLFNDKKILLDMNHKDNKMKYRYLTKREIRENKLRLNKSYEWLEATIYKTYIDEDEVIFINVEGTPINLYRGKANKEKE
ncbi:hypothetical protein P4639_21950 [Priestia megaterium]|uniref:hypothetical protein n=1 Tax=Priestia megaterium TaxID=1404 RepID=UPI002E1F7B0D|nr:hypothetical protein [Priestia megaterium]